MVFFHRFHIILLYIHSCIIKVVTFQMNSDLVTLDNMTTPDATPEIQKKKVMQNIYLLFFKEK